MAYHNYFLILIIAVLSINLSECAEFVPVFMWGTTKVSEHVPALHKISQDSFKDTLLEYLKGDPYIIVFAEHNLSPEDFAQRDQNGETAFRNIHALKKEKVHVSYKPYVQNAIGAIKQLNKPVTEISIGSLLSSSTLPKNILIIDLNDAKDDETRFHMLQRHDSDIVSIYKAVLEQHDNVCVIYTAHHTAWVAPEDVTRSRTRNLLQNEEPEAEPSTAIIFQHENVLIYLTENGTYEKRVTGSDPFQVNITGNFTLTAEANNITVNASLRSTELEIKFDLLQKVGYWYIDRVSVNENSETEEILKGPKDFYAPVQFSYHCADLNLTNKDGNISLKLPGFQIQSFAKNNSYFRDAYDCTGFTSVPIWSGLFVTAILLLIITFGLTMMMDIKTMDRFDDPKGKTITVTASE